MDIGIPTLIEHHSIEEAAKLAHTLGFRFVELNMNLPWVISSLNADELERISLQYQVYFTIHADENLFFCDFNHRVSHAHLESMLELIHIAKATHIPLINFHMSAGVYFTLPSEKVFLFEKFESEYQNKLLAFATKCNQAAEDKVALCIENTGQNHAFIHRGIDALLSYPAFHLTWDIGHDYSAGLCDSPFLLQRNVQIIHMHLHDAVGKSCHLPLGKGEMHPENFLKRATPQRVVVEVKTIQGLYESISWLKEHQLI